MSIFNRKFAFILLPVLLFVTGQKASAVEISPSQNHINSFAVSMLEDKENHYSLNQALKSTHWQLNQNRITQGYSRSGYWHQFDLTNAAPYPRTFLVEFSEAFFEKIDLYRKKADGTWAHQVNGLKTPIDQRAFFDPNPVFKVTVMANSSTPLVFNTYSKIGHYGAFIVHSEASYNENKNLRTHLYTFLLGALIAILIYNLFLFLQLKQKIYVYYLLHSTFFVAWVLLYSGWVTVYFSGIIHLLWHISLPLAFIFLMLFSQTLLKSKTNHPAIHSLLNIALILYLISIAIIPFDLCVGFEMHNLISVLALPLLLMLGIQSILKHNPMGKIFTFALLIYLVGMTLSGFMALGMLPYNEMTRNALFIGSFIEIVTFSLALGYRINILKAHKIQTQQKHIHAAYTYRKSLEMRVEERTKELEKALLNEKQLLEQYREFSSLISHEFRNPLGIIKSQLSVLKKEHIKGIDNIQKRASTMNGAISRLELIFDEWIVNDRLNNQAFEPNLKSFSSSPWIESITELLRQNHPSHTLILEGNMIRLNVDESLVKILLFNLIDNACKYSPQHTTICIRTLEKLPYVGFQICDQGQGIEKEFQEIIFEPYTRYPFRYPAKKDTGSNALTQNKAEAYDDITQPGLGLGLSLTKRIVDAHNGQIEIESEIEKGTCIQVLFPA